jgi:HlyD family secretion protein
MPATSLKSAALAPTPLAPAPGATAAVAKPRRAGKRKWLWLGLGLIAVLAAGGAYARHRRAAAGIPITTEKAVVRTITQVVTATGKVQPEIEVKISPEVYGEITALPFREGARVRKGDLLVKIKPDMYQAQVEQQTAAVASTTAVAVDMQAKFVKAEADLKKYQDLYRRKLISDSDFVTYSTNYDVAKADHDSGLANVDQAQGLLKQARDALSKTVIYSPMDGTVSSLSSEVGERVVATGSFAGTEIMRVADLGHMEVRVKVNENDVVNVKVGDRAEIAIDAYPDRKFAGVVREIASSAENSGASGSGASSQSSSAVTDEVTNFIVKIRVSDRTVALRPGMSATADIQTRTVAGAVTVPIQSVTVRDAAGLSSEQLEERKVRLAKEKSGNDLEVSAERDQARRDREQLVRVVFIKTGDTVRLQKVETGIADNTSIEITKGVKPGDEVVAGSYAAISRKLKDGSRVTIEPPKPEPEDTK